ncbi:hypothetical protein CHS0354_001135 [Potamilus streckersoni]|uniref:Uncharacterized protein n=1 Tax=Potamilus streckersoni TaxID=2493646 RepID=A0AAE0SYU7_9BIVA|nr:hypothetical protein CHS0354_001135 [Potamilus streckersoni]
MTGTPERDRFPAQQDTVLFFWLLGRHRIGQRLVGVLAWSWFLTYSCFQLSSMAGLTFCSQMQMGIRHSMEIAWIMMFIIGTQPVHGAIISPMLNQNDDHSYGYNISKQNTNISVATEINISSQDDDNKGYGYGYMKITSIHSSNDQTVISQAGPTTMTQEPTADSNSSLSELNETYSTVILSQLAELTHVQTTPIVQNKSEILRKMEPQFFESSRNVDIHENRKSHLRHSEISKTLWLSNGRNIHPLNHKLQLVPYEDHPFGNYLWKDKKYVVSIFIPVGLGILGALMIVVLTYSVRRCAKNNPAVEAAAQHITASISQDFDRRSDQINLLGHGTDEDI